MAGCRRKTQQSLVLLTCFLTTWRFLLRLPLGPRPSLKVTAFSSTTANSDFPSVNTASPRPAAWLASHSYLTNGRQTSWNEQLLCLTRLLCCEMRGMEDGKPPKTKTERNEKWLPTYSTRNGNFLANSFIGRNTSSSSSTVAIPNLSF